MEPSPVLDDFILGQVRRPTPRICFVPTASGDNENYIVRFYRRFSRGDCRPTHLELFRRAEADLTAFACSQDIIYVGGGNTANMLAVWRLHGFDASLRAALDQGTVLAGISAGSVCWFEAGVTDSFGSKLVRLDGLGWLAGSNCPHYDGEAERRPTYQRLIREGMVSGIAADDGVGLHYIDGSLHRVVTSRAGARAYRVERDGAATSETPLEAELLAP